MLSQCEENVEHLARENCELSLLSAKIFLNFPNSTVAAASLALARITFGNDPWPADIAEKTLISFSNIKECIKELNMMKDGEKNNVEQMTRNK